MKLIFRYGTMNSAKTANLLMAVHNLQSHGKKVKVLKPATDSRFGINNVKSRALADSRQVDLIIEHYMINFECVLRSDCVFVDEAQFLTKENVDGLRELAKHTTVICYGLRTDYKGELFAGSKRLLEIADTIEEIKTSCIFCHRKAIMNAKFNISPVGEKQIVRTGSSVIDLGCEEKYMQLCWNCYMK